MYTDAYNWHLLASCVCSKSPDRSPVPLIAMDWKAEAGALLSELSRSDCTNATTSRSDRSCVFDTRVCGGGLTRTREWPSRHGMLRHGGA